MNQFKFEKYRFEDLEIWKLGMKIVSKVYDLVKKFPKEEAFALSDQLKRASTSIVLNIVEGSGQPTSKAFSLYLSRAKSSAIECVACVKIAEQQKFITQLEASDLEEVLREEYFKIIGMIKSIQQK